jgi:hypothetical protein
VQVAVKLDPDPVANLFLQPGNTLPFILKVIFDVMLTVAVITIAILYAATVAPPASWNRAKVGGDKYGAKLMITTPEPPEPPVPCEFGVMQ